MKVVLIDWEMSDLVENTGYLSYRLLRCIAQTPKQYRDSEVVLKALL